MQDANITKDALYEAVSPDDFSAMLNLDRFNNRSPAFDRIIAASHDHFWDPLDLRYIDFGQPFDLRRSPLICETLIGALKIPYVSEHLSDPQQRTAFINDSALRIFSSLLHGEQGALNLSASLCHVLYDQGAQEYAANQAREEARHVTAFSRYIASRWGAPAPCSPALQGLLVEIIRSPAVYKKIVGMQVLVEGLAMGAFATLYKKMNDPVGRRMLQLIMTDEAFHHKFGKVWADRTVPRLSDKERTIIEYWAAHCFQALLFNFVAPHEQRDLYERYGMDPERVIAEFKKTSLDAYKRDELTDNSNMFRVLVKTLINAGLVTEKTRKFYAMYVDMDQLEAEDDRLAGEDIADEGIEYLKEINFKDRVANLVA